MFIQKYLSSHLDLLRTADPPLQPACDTGEGAADCKQCPGARGAVRRCQGPPESPAQPFSCPEPGRDC